MCEFVSYGTKRQIYYLLLLIDQDFAAYRFISAELLFYQKRKQSKKSNKKSLKI
jgi:hypothetical protein